MTTIMLALETNPELIAELRTNATSDTVVGESTLAQSPVDALDTPLSAEDVKTIAETCVVVFKAATALTIFIKTLLASLQARPGTTATIRDPKTGEVCVHATATTTESELLAALPGG